MFVRLSFCCCFCSPPLWGTCTIQFKNLRPSELSGHAGTVRPSGKITRLRSTVRCKFLALMRWKFLALIARCQLLSQSSPVSLCSNARFMVEHFLPPVVSAFHEVSVYPKKELPFFILFTAGLCTFTALLALLTHQFPEPMGVIAKAVSTSRPAVDFTKLFLNLGLILGLLDE